MKRADWKEQGVLTVKLSQKDVRWLRIALLALLASPKLTAHDREEIIELGGWLGDQEKEARKGVRCH